MSMLALTVWPAVKTGRTPGKDEGHLQMGLLMAPYRVGCIKEWAVSEIALLCCIGPLPTLQDGWDRSLSKVGLTCVPMGERML